MVWVFINRTCKDCDTTVWLHGLYWWKVEPHSDVTNCKRWTSCFCVPSIVNKIRGLKCTIVYNNGNKHFKKYILCCSPLLLYYITCLNRAGQRGICHCWNDEKNCGSLPWVDLGSLKMDWQILRKMLVELC